MFRFSKSSSFVPNAKSISKPPVVTAPDNNNEQHKKKDLRAIRKLRDTELLRQARILLGAGKAEADLMLQVLSTRKLNTQKRQEYKEIVRHFQSETGLCRMVDANSAELVGLKLFPGQDTPTHVYGAAIHRLFKRWKRSTSSLSFPQYFSKRASDRDYAKAEQNQVRYLSPEEQVQHEVVFSAGGVLRKYNNQRWGRGTYMFVLDHSGTRLLLARKNSGMHHSSLISEGCCACAGMMKLKKDGTIKSSNLQSGHFRPGPEKVHVLRNFLKHPQRLGALADRIKIKKFTTDPFF